MQRTTTEEEVVAQPTTADEVVAEPVIAEEIISVAPERIQAHLRYGQAYFKAGRYIEALKEFETILKTAPGSIETRVWLRKVKEQLTKPKIETIAEEEAIPLAEEAGPKECVWMKLGIVSHRLCTHNYDCLTCEFDQMMEERIARGEVSELDTALERFKKLPGNQRLCRYALKGAVSHRLCTHNYNCATCEFAQTMEDALAQKLAKLAVRREALRKKKQSVSQA